eukprot:gene39211-47711_t
MDWLEENGISFYAVDTVYHKHYVDRYAYGIACQVNWKTGKASISKKDRAIVEKAHRKSKTPQALGYFAAQHVSGDFEMAPHDAYIPEEDEDEIDDNGEDEDEGEDEDQGGSGEVEEDAKSEAVGTVGSAGDNSGSGSLTLGMTTALATDKAKMPSFWPSLLPLSLLRGVLLPLILLCKSRDLWTTSSAPRQPLRPLSLLPSLPQYLPSLPPIPGPSAPLRLPSLLPNPLPLPSLHLLRTLRRSIPLKYLRK